LYENVFGITRNLETNFKTSGFQAKIVFKQSFKYLKNEKNNFIKVILKLKCLFDFKRFFERIKKNFTNFYQLLPAYTSWLKNS